MPFDPEFLAVYGLPGLFLATALSGSVVPLPSEAVLAALIWRGEAFAAAVAVATVGNVLGAATLFWIGGRLAAGSDNRFTRWLQRRTGGDAARIERARARLARWGAPALLLTWMPVAGDAVVIASGFAGVRWPVFLLWCGIGKAVRFGVVAASVVAVAAS